MIIQHFGNGKEINKVEIKPPKRLVNLLVYHIFNTSKDYTIEYLENCIKCHIDNSIRLGWRKEDIIIKGNIPIDHDGVKCTSIQEIENYQFKGENIFLCKLLSLIEVYEQYKCDIWLHDHDTWQVQKFPEIALENDFTFCNYAIDWIRPQGASVFVKYDNKIINLIKDYINNKKYHIKDNDESVLELFRGKYPDSFNSDMSIKFNSSITRTTHSRRFDENCYCFHGDINNGRNIRRRLSKVKNYDEELKNLFMKYKLL
jgi:hypothetical protein